MKKLKKNMLVIFDMSLLAIFCGKIAMQIVKTTLELSYNKYRNGIKK
jgi:hypothetical protein